MPRTVGALKTTISLDDTQFQNSMQGINRQLRGLKAETRAVTSSGTGFARGVTEMRAKADVLNRTLEVQRAKVSELRRQYEESKRTTGENSRETQLANVQYQRAVAEMNKTENALKGLTAEIRRQEDPWRQLSQNMDRAGRSMQEYGRNMTSFGRTMSMRVTAPILGLGGAALKVGMDFEEGMSKVQALTQGTASDMERLEEQARDLGATTRFSATEAADAMGFLGMAGFETNEILETMPGLLDLAASSGMELGRAADIATNIMSGFSLEAEEAGRVADILAASASSANTNVEQLGDAMKYVAPIASTLDLEMEGLTASVGLLSDSGIQGSQAGRQLRQGLLRLTDPTGAAADLIEELGINVFDADGNMKDMYQVVGELEKGLGDMDAQAQAAALSTIFGSESTAGWSTLLDEGSSTLREYTKELENSEGAAKNMADTMQDNAKGSMIEFKSALEGAGIELAQHMLPRVTDLVDKATELARSFGDLDDDTQQTIINMGLLAAAIGPAAIVAGNLTTALGGILRVGGNVIGMLSGAGGLIARIGALGMAGPVGLAVAGVGALAGGIYLLSRRTSDLHDVNWDVVESMRENVEQTDEMIDRYEELELKNRLTTDEMLRYMDILSELKQTSGHEAVKELTKEQEQLLEKSGLTNDEMEEFIKLNGEIIERAPETEKAISDQGNAYALTADKVKELNNRERERLMIQAREELKKALENEVTLLEKQETLVKEIKQLDDDLVQNEKEREQAQIDYNQAKEEERKLWQEVLDLEDYSTLEGQRKYEQKLQEYDVQREIVEELERENDRLGGVYENILKKIDKKEEDLELTRDEIKELENAKWGYEELILAQVDLTSERGNGLSVLEDEIKAIDRQRVELETTTSEQRKGTQQYQEQIDKLGTQKARLKSAKEELERINELAKRTVYDKRINISTSPNIQSINDILARPVNKRVNVAAGGAYATYADGTPSGGHPGGLFLAGEEGWELGRMGNQWEVLNAGFYERPRGYEVFTHEQSKRIMRSLNNVPRYADGTGNLEAETNRIANRMYEQQTNQPVVIEMHITNEMDGREVGRTVEKYVTEIQDRNKGVRESFA